MSKKYESTFILSLGGSLIAPAVGIDAEYLQKFNQFIRNQITKDRRFFIVTGGGDVCRKYQTAGRKATHNQASDEDIDWLGTHSTRLNAHLIRTIFSDIAHQKIIFDYNIIEKTDEPVVVAGGWKPGRSSDYEAVILAEDYGAQKIINLSNIKNICTADPKKDFNAKPLHDISWKDYRSFIGDKWTPGLNSPFDPIASKLAEKLKLDVYVIDGHNLKSLSDILENLPFEGTVIHP